MRAMPALFQRRGDVAHIPERSRRLVIRRGESIALVELLCRMDSYLPAVAGEVVAHEVAFALIDQIGRVEIETLALPPLSERCAPSSEEASGSGMCSVASWLPGALSAVMLSNNRSWASDGR